jgi:signal transduction histidine kinase
VYFSVLVALTIVAKYAGAEVATVTLAQANGDLSFTVRDEGSGFDTTVTPSGTGLQGITDRLDAIGGRLEVRSAVGQGTTVIGHVPAAPHRGSG